MKRLFAGNLPSDTTERELTEMFSAFGKVRSIKLMHDVFSGQRKGFGFSEMEGHDARAGLAGLFGKELRGKPPKVTDEQPRDKFGKGPRRR